MKIRDKLFIVLKKLININYHKRLLIHNKLGDFIDALSKANDMSADISDCIAVYEDIINLKPNYILELGPGTSTVAMCLAINEVKEVEPNYSPVFVAIESREEWLDYHKKTIPIELQSNVDLISRDEAV